MWRKFDGKIKWYFQHANFMLWYFQHANFKFTVLHIATFCPAFARSLWFIQYGLGTCLSVSVLMYVSSPADTRRNTNAIMTSKRRRSGLGGHCWKYNSNTAPFSSSSQTHGVIITSLLRQNDVVLTSWWRYYYVMCPLGYYDSFDDRVSVDFIYRHPIFKWVAVATWKAYAGHENPGVDTINNLNLNLV